MSAPCRCSVNGCRRKVVAEECRVVPLTNSIRRQLHSLPLTLTMTFKYDVVTFIELVESKPCLWDKTNGNHKNKISRERCWKEIFNSLDDEYELLSKEDKEKTREIIMNKWNNIRDSFLRSVKLNSGQNTKRNYIYGEHLNFLQTNYNQHHTFQDRIDAIDYLELSCGSDSQPKLSPSSKKSMHTHRKVEKSKTDLRDSDSVIELKKKKSNESYPESTARTELEILMLSFIPHLRDMSESELLDFQMETLTTIKKIKQQRNCDVRQMTTPPIISYQSLMNQSPNLIASDPLTASFANEGSTSTFVNNAVLQNMKQERCNYTGVNKYEQPFD